MIGLPDCIGSRMLTPHLLLYFIGQRTCPLRRAAHGTSPAVRGRILSECLFSGNFPPPYFLRGCLRGSRQTCQLSLISVMD